MFKLIATILTIVVAVVSAKPGILSPYAAAAPLISAPLVASAPFPVATSSQFIARNYNGILAPAAPFAAVAYAPQIIGSDAETFSLYTAYPQVQYPYHPATTVVGAPLKYVAAAGAPFVL